MNKAILASALDITEGQKIALGNDLVFIPDFESSLTDLFKRKVYTAEEIAYCMQFTDALVRFASTWAAKEAVYKAVKQINPLPLPWKSIQITREKIAGRPHVSFRHHPSGVGAVSLSISHDGAYVWAIAIIERA